MLNIWQQPVVMAIAIAASIPTKFCTLSHLVLTRIRRREEDAKLEHVTATIHCGRRADAVLVLKLAVTVLSPRPQLWWRGVAEPQPDEETLKGEHMLLPISCLWWEARGCCHSARPGAEQRLFVVEMDFYVQEFLTPHHWYLWSPWLLQEPTSKLHQNLRFHYGSVTFSKILKCYGVVGEL